MPHVPKILCVSANPAVDRKIILSRIHLSEVNRAASVHPAAGGKAAHVALAARTLGAEVTWLAFLGGPEGDLCSEQLAKHGIAPVGVPVQGHTRVNLELCETDSGRITEVLEPGPTITPLEAEDFVRTFRAQLTGSPIVVISGSLPQGLTPDFYAQLIRIAKAQGCRVLLDTSGDALLSSIGAGADVIKPNRQEAAVLLKSEVRDVEGAVQAAKQLHARGIPVAIISLGDEGAVVASDGAVLVGIPPKIRARSTVGSGDCFVAGWAVSEGQGKNPRDSLRMAIACGTANCLAESPALIDLSNVNDFLPQVQIKEY